MGFMGVPNEEVEKVQKQRQSGSNSKGLVTEVEPGERDDIKILSDSCIE